MMRKNSCLILQLGLICIWLMSCQPASPTARPVTFTPIIQPSVTPSAPPTRQFLQTPTATSTPDGPGRFVGTFGTGYFSGVFRSPDGKRIFVPVNGNELRWYDAQTLQQEGAMTLSDDPFDAHQVIFGPDPNLVVVVGFYRMFIVDLKNQKVVADRIGADGYFSSIQFSADTKQLFVHYVDIYNHGLAHRVYAVNTQQNQRVHSYWQTDDFTSISDPVISPDEKWIAVGYGNLLQIRDIQTEELLRSFAGGHNSEITSVAVNKDGSRLASVDKDGVVRLWNSETGQKLGKYLPKLGTQVTKLSFSDDGQQLLATLDDRSQQTINLKTGQIDGPFMPALEPLAISLHHQGYSQFDYGSIALAISPDGKTLAVGSGTVLLWDIQAQKLLSVLENPGNFSIHQMKFDPTGRLLVAIADNKTLLWDITASAQPNLAKILGPIVDLDWRDGLSFSSNGKYIAVGRRNNVEIWDVETEQRVRTLSMSGKAKYVLDVQFLPDNQSLYAVVQMERSEDATGYASQLQQWNFKTGQMLHSIDFFGRSPDVSAFRWPFFAFENGDNDQNNWVEIWNIESATLKKMVGTQASPTFFSKDGRLLFGVDVLENHFSIWQMQPEKQVYTSPLLREAPDYLKYSLDLLSASNLVAIYVYQEGVVRLFDISEIIEKARQP